MFSNSAMKHKQCNGDDLKNTGGSSGLLDCCNPIASIFGLPHKNKMVSLPFSILGRHTERFAGKLIHWNFLTEIIYDM